MPTCACHAVTALFEVGYLKDWIQKNHKGLPQKAVRMGSVVLSVCIGVKCLLCE